MKVHLMEITEYEVLTLLNALDGRNMGNLDGDDLKNIDSIIEKLKNIEEKIE